MDKRSQIERTNQGWLAALVLVVWAPVAGELVTSSAPPAIFFVPWVFLVFACLYGLGALLIRELAVRLRLAWPAVILLGAAYGVLEEGLGAKSFFDPNWRAIGLLGEHGRALGVNWVWAFGLSGFHAFHSVALSILAVGVLFPSVRHRPWVGKPVLAAAAVLFGLDALLFYQKGNENYSNTAVQSAACVGLILLLTALALLLPRRGTPTSNDDSAVARSWRTAAVCGFSAAATFIGLLYFFPYTGAPGWFTGLMVAALFTAIALACWRRAKLEGGALSRLTSFGVLAGVYGFFAVHAPLQEFNPNRPDSAAGMTLVGAGLALGLWVLGKRLVQRPDRTACECGGGKEVHGY